MVKKPVRSFSEHEILALLHKKYAKTGTGIKKGIGDDAAVIQPGSSGEYWLITTDMLVEGVDFLREWTTPRQIGHKSISVNLSDIAAMGALPRFFTVSLGLPPGISRHWITEFYRGLNHQGSKYGAVLIGGDLSSSSESILISITAVGESVGRKVLYRSGAREGDALYVTGTLGKSAAGLKLLLSGHARTRTPLKREAVRCHREPEPRCQAGLWLAQSGLVRCMMDLSDGLSTDLPRLCKESGTAAEIDSCRLPVFAEAAGWDMNPLYLALHGGEDFELLFAVPESKSSVLRKNYPDDLPPITRIGKMVRGKGEVWIRSGKKNRHRLKNLGYDHFSQKPF